MPLTLEQQRIHRRVMDAASNVAVRHKLPYQVHVLVSDPITDKKYGAFVRIEYIGNNRMARVTRTSIGELREGATPLDIADTLIRRNPGTPLVCDEQTVREIGDSSLILVSDGGHYRLASRPEGVLDIYQEHKTTMIDKEELPPGFSGRIFLE
ncbi:MAG: hypothetical protein HYU56_01845 [Candidatus Aenigmarchaeota archaeon]|nr:hypothetical protein [Candidatus Aenigmarchaeota archaeon]